MDLSVSAVLAVLGLAVLADAQVEPTKECKVINFSDYYSRLRGEWIIPSNGKNAEVYWGYGLRVDGQNNEQLVVMDTDQPDALYRSTVTVNQGNGIVIQDPYNTKTPVPYGPGVMLFKFETPVTLMGMDFVKSYQPFRVSLRDSTNKWGPWMTVDKAGVGHFHHEFMANDVTRVKVKLQDAGAVTKIEFCNYCEQQGGNTCATPTESPTATPIPPDTAPPGVPPTEGPTMVPLDDRIDVPTGNVVAEFNPGFKEPTGEVCREDGHCADVFEYDITGFSVELFNSVLEGQCVGKPTKLIGYGGTVPAETMHVVSGREAYAQFNNMITEADAPRPDMFNALGCDTATKTGVPMTVHNHGQASLAPFDGFATNVFCLGETQSYQFPDNRPTTGWFHDHALLLTAETVLYGLYGLYLITEKIAKGGCGEPYNLEDMEEVHMIMNDAVIDSECQILFEKEDGGPHEDSYFGDINLVNGRPFPVLGDMKRKYYRFRTLNASVSRPFLLRLITSEAVDVSSQFCTIIGSDGGYLERGPVAYPSVGLMVGVAERWEFVCDFSQLDSSVSELFMYNDFDDERMKDVPYFTYSNFLTKFEFEPVGAPLGNAPLFNPNDRGNIGQFVPGTVLDEAIPQALQMIQEGVAHRTIKFGRGGGQWVINGETWNTDRVAANDVGQNTWELWEIDTGGGWFHPVHIHLIDFFILAREDRDGVFAPDTFGQSGAPKDVLYLGPSETVWVIARFGPHKGEYMIHCHNLIHEDDLMIRTYITVTNTEADPGGRNAGNNDQAFLEVNDIIYDNYAFADPSGAVLGPVPTATVEPTLMRAQTFLDANFYRIFYPLPGDVEAVQNNPWLAQRALDCPA